MHEQRHEGPEEGHEQHHQAGRGEQEQERGQGGGGVHEKQPVGCGQQQQQDNSLIARLKYPEDNVSPKWVKSRRRRVRDNLKQAKIQFQPAPVAKIQNYLSDGGLSCPSGGPWGYQERERGCKRGLEDQMGGPAGKKMKD